MTATHPSGAPVLDGSNPNGRNIQRLTSKQSAVRELREQQDLILSRLKNPDLTDRDASMLSRAWVDLRNQIRVEKGMIKPGSRNISVREPHPSELKAKLLKPVLSGLIEQPEHAPEPCSAPPAQD